MIGYSLTFFFKPQTRAGTINQIGQTQILVMKIIYTDISCIIFSSFEPEPEFLKAVIVPDNRDRNLDSAPVSGWIIRFQ